MGGGGGLTQKEREYQQIYTHFFSFLFGCDQIGFRTMQLCIITSPLFSLTTAFFWSVSSSSFFLFHTFLLFMY